jgi:hypothetical protein
VTARTPNALGFVPVGTLTVTRTDDADESLVSVLVPVTDVNLIDVIKDPAIQSYFDCDVPIVFAFETETAMDAFKNITDCIRRKYAKEPTHRGPKTRQ